MAAYADVVSLMNNIEQIMSHPRLSTSLDNRYIQPLVEKTGLLLDFIEDCYNHGGVNKEVAEYLERRIASAAHAAEDVIESHIVDQIQVGTCEVSLRCSLDLQQIIQDIDDIIKEATEEKQKWGVVKSMHAAELLMKSRESMVGLDDELIQLLDELTGYQSSRHIISIVGMGGTGKTTLATNVYQHALIKEHFSIRAWATISQQYSAEGILSNLLSSIGKSTSSTKDALGEELHKILCGRRYLILLDDIWSVEAWDTVRRFFPDDGNRSRVVLTTRLSNVANDCGSSYCLKIDLLDEDKSWKLFCDKASFPQKDDPPQLEDVGKEIVESCKGLALSIAVIGGLLLKSPRTIGYWKGIAKDMRSVRDSKEKQESLDVMSLSYTHLPPHLKPCFLYMGMFKEDSEIRVSNIIKLWICKGFIKPNGSREREEVAECYINDLIDRNLILVGRRRSNGKIGFCGFHDLLRDLSLKIAEDQNFVHVGRYNIPGSRRIIDSFCLDPTKVPLARSIINYTQEPIDYKCRLLRVFHEAGWDKNKEYYENVNLRYIAYSYSYGGILKIPSSLSLLWNLQTFIIKQGKVPFAVFVMPDEFWKMRQLKHVECGNIYLPNPPEDEVLMLEKLQSLKGLINLRLSEEVCNIISNTKKLRLKYHFTDHGYDESYVKFLCNLDRLHKLESLNLNLDYKFTQSNNVVRFPGSLKKLSLKECYLGWEDISAEIGWLPQLEVLDLGFRSFQKGQEWRPVDEQFLRLKFLKIRYCNLTDWIADSCHFPVLEKLLLEYLEKMKEIPSGIGDIPTLQLIRVDCCSEDAAISAIKIKEDRVENDDNDDLQIQVVVARLKFESFTERLKREELTINNIQLERR